MLVVIPRTIAELASSRLLLIVAHPDDEVIGAGALLAHTTRARILHITDGSPENPADALAAGFTTREDYASARIAEARDALAIAGIRREAVANLRYTDQKVSFRLGELTQDLVEIFHEEGPEIVLTHAYEGGHPDHDSVAFACHMAHEIYTASDHCTAPRLIEFAGYHGAGGHMNTYEFLQGSALAEIRHELIENERELKIAMLQCFKTQSKTLQPFLSARFEFFRHAPNYDFTAAPHTGPLLYEQFPWGMDGVTWRSLALAALGELRSFHWSQSEVSASTRSDNS